MDKTSEVETKFGKRWYLPTNYLRLSHNGKPALIQTEDGRIVEEYSDVESLQSECSSIRGKSVGSTGSLGSIKKKLKETGVKYSDMKAEMGMLKERVAELELKTKSDDKMDASVQTVDAVNNTNSGFNLNSQNVFPAILEPESWQCSPTGNELLSEVYRRMNCTIDDAKKYFILNFIKQKVPIYVENSIRSKAHLPMKVFLQKVQFELMSLENTMRNYSVNLYNNVNDEIYDDVDFDEDRICEKHRRFGPHAYYCEQPDECPYEHCIVPRPRRNVNYFQQY